MKSLPPKKSLERKGRNGVFSTECALQQTDAADLDFVVSDKSDPQSGISVVSILVLFGVGGLLLKVVMDLFSQNLASIAQQQDLNKVEDLRRFIRFGMVCPPAKPAWVMKSEIAIPKRDGGIQPLIQIGSIGVVATHIVRFSQLFLVDDVSHQIISPNLNSKIKFTVI